MKIKKNSNELFIKACESVGLEVRPVRGRSVAKGLVISDARGNRYTVDADAKIQKIDTANYTMLNANKTREHLSLVIRRRRGQRKHVLRGEKAIKGIVK